MTEIPVVELVRVSSEAQAGEDRQGIPAQRRANAETCARFSLRVVETVEIVESGATVARSAEMARALDVLRSGRAQGIVLAAYDRLFRPDNWTDFQILQVIAEAGALIYKPSGPIDLRTEPGFIEASINNLTAGLERRRIRERTMRAREERRRAGKLPSGRAPFGMAWDEGQGWSYTEEIAEVKETHARYLGGERSLRSLMARFGRTKCHIECVLQRPIYAGWLIYPATDRIKWNHERRWPPIFPEAPDGAIRVQTGLEPAIPVPEFLEAQRILQHRKERVSLSRSGKPERFLYRGMLRCACGQAVYTASPKHRDYYFCRTVREPHCGECDTAYIRRDRLEAALDRVMEDQLLDPALIADVVEAHNASLGAAWREGAPDAARAGKRRRELGARRARVLETFFAGLIDAAERDRQVGAVDAQLAALPSEAGPAPLAIRETDVRAIVEAFEFWAGMSWAGRRGVLEAIAPTFVVRDYCIEGMRLYLDGPSFS